MKFGLFSSAQANNSDLGPQTGQGFRDYLDYNVEAEALGYASSFSVEHHFTGWNQVSATLMLLMALATRTKTLRLGTAVIVLPWHNPVLWVAAASEHSIRRAAARGFNLILDQYASAEQIGERIGTYKAECKARGLRFDPMQVAVARQLYVANDEADKQAALARQAAYTQRTVDVSRAPERKGGSHVLAYADKAGGTEENALYGTPDEICAMLEVLQKSGVGYVLLTISGGAAQLRRFAREIMPLFAQSAAADVA